MRLNLLHNPTAGEEDVTEADLSRLLEAGGHDVRSFSVKDEEEACEALSEAADLVVVAGGDGTVRKTAIAMVRLRSATPLAILPMGTGNNVAKSLHAFLPLPELVAGWPQAGRRRLDVGIVRAPWGERRFLEAVGAGLVQRTIALMKQHDDPPLLPGSGLDRPLALLAELLGDGELTPIRVEIDGAEVADDHVLVEVVSTPMIGPNLRLAPGADPGDGLFDVVTVPASRAASLREHLASRLAGQPGDAELPTRRGRRVVLRTAAPIHVDGKGDWSEDDNDDDREHPDGAEIEFEITVEGSIEVVVSSRAPVPRHE